jgi:CRISPR-associated exonuclease Cas4
LVGLVIMITEGAGLVWLVVSFALLLTALLLWLVSRKNLATSGLPAGKIIYSDDGSWIPVDKPLYSEELNLVGRPDYVVNKTDGTIIPVELKSAKAPNRPLDGHIMQLAAYCFLVEQNFEIRPPYGILQYRDRAYAVEYNDELELDLELLVDEMHQDLHEIEVDRDHEEWIRCERCHFNPVCSQSLA